MSREPVTAPQRLVFCSGMPRSGSTWSYNVVRLLLEGAFGVDAVAASYVGEGNPVDEYVKSRLDSDGVTLIKLHYPSAFVRSVIASGHASNICTLRHPLAALASAKEFFGMSFDGALKSIKQSLIAADEWRRGSDTLFVEFGAMMSDPGREVRRIADYLGLASDDALIDRVVAETSFERTQRESERLAHVPREALVAAGNSHYDPTTLLHVGHAPKGVARDWRDELSADEQRIAMRELAPWLGEWNVAADGASREAGEPAAKETIEARVRSFPFWYHKIALPHGVVTPGWAPLSPAAYRIPERLDGKRVLDVGAWDGYWTFEALKRGAREVVAIDDFSDFLGSLDDADRKAWGTFDLCREILGYDEDRCRRIEMSVYDVDEASLGRFDVVFFFGTLYHLRHPLLALDRLAAVCEGEIYVESAILDDFSPYRGGLNKGYPGRQMVMEFYPGKEYGNNEANWWVPTLQCLVHMVAAAGFRGCRGWKLADRPEGLPHCRGFAFGRKPQP